MKQMKFALIAALTGAISMAPVHLLPASAAVLASALSGTQLVTSGSFGAVAGDTTTATTQSAYVVSPATSICSFGKTTSGGSTSSGSATIKLNNVTSLAVGMIISTTTGIAAGTKVTAINSGTTTVTVTPVTTAAISNNTALTFSGCYQRFFSVNNIKTIALTAFQIQQVVSTSAPDSITLQSCAGTWTEATAVCSGAITNIVVTSSGTSAFVTVSTVLAASTGTIRLRALCNTSGQNATISINIVTANLRAAVTTNS